MPLYEYHCPDCGNVEERIGKLDERNIDCSHCGGTAERKISVSGVNCANDDAPWIRSVLEVVDKDSTAPHVVEFRKNPTRTNYKAWMKGEGIRPAEGGERRQKKDFNVDRHAEKVWEARQARHRIEI